MPSEGSTFRFVSSSPVRYNTLRYLDDQPRTTADLIDRIDASKSAVYGGLDDLEARGLVRKADEGWVLTGHGQLLADLVHTGHQYSDLGEELHTYFSTHDVSVLPFESRLRIGMLNDAELITAPKNRPQYVINRVADELDAASRGKIMSRIVTESYAKSMPDTRESKLLLDREIVESTIDDEDRYDTVENAEVRFGSVPASMAITDDTLMLSLPTLDGKYDPQSEIFAETEQARAWGRRLFESYWNQGVPPEEFMSDP